MAAEYSQPAAERRYTQINSGRVLSALICVDLRFDFGVEGVIYRGWRLSAVVYNRPAGTQMAVEYTRNPDVVLSAFLSVDLRLCFDLARKKARGGGDRRAVEHEAGSGLTFSGEKQGPG
jgi:hypothetical protein